MTWKRLSPYRLFVREVQLSRVGSLTNGWWRGSLTFTLMFKLLHKQWSCLEFATAWRSCALNVMPSLCAIPLWLSVAESIKVKSRLNHCHRQIEKLKKHSYNWTPLTTKTTTVPTTILSGVVAHWIRQHDVTMVDEYKYDRTTPNTHTNKDIQMSPFHKFDSENNVIPSLYRFEVLYKVCIWNLQNEIRQLNRGHPHGDRDSIFNTFTHGLCAKCTAFKRWRHGNRAFLLAEKGISLLPTAASW